MYTRAECINRLTEMAPYIRKEFGVESMRLFGMLLESIGEGVKKMDKLLPGYL